MTATIQVSNAAQTRTISKEIERVTPYLLQTHKRSLTDSIKNFAMTQMQPGEQIKDITWQ